MAFTEWLEGKYCFSPKQAAEELELQHWQDRKGAIRSLQHEVREQAGAVTERGPPSQLAISHPGSMQVVTYRRLLRNIEQQQARYERHALAIASLQGSEWVGLVQAVYSLFLMRSTTMTPVTHGLPCHTSMSCSAYALSTLNSACWPCGNMPGGRQHISRRQSGSMQTRKRSQPQLVLQACPPARMQTEGARERCDGCHG